VPLAVHRGRWTLADRAEEIYRELPFELPAGAPGLTATLRYDRRAGVLDLGCFGPAWDGPVGAGPAGFRGWSGGARDTFTVTPDRATPGYLAGPLPAGEWQVCLGLHRIPADGLEYEVVVDLGGVVAPEPPPPPVPADRPPRRELPAEPGRRWLAGDLHTHTVHSDGKLTVPELAVLAAQRGLDFLAVTDHNTISHHAELAAASRRYGIILLPGQEVTTDGGHAGALGDVGWIDFRQEPDAWLDATEAAGGLLSVNHPFAGPVSWTRPMRRRPPLIEAWHWSWLDLRWTTPLSWWLAWDPAAIPVGGSDWHRPGSDAPPGRPTTWVECEGDQPGDVLDGLRAGRVAISAERDGPVLFRRDDALVAVDADGLTLAGPQGPCARVRGDRATLPGSPGPHRLLDPAGAALALCP